MYIPETSSPHFFDKVPDENYESPWNDARIAAFQKKIDKIAGLASNGKSNVRLIWPASSDESISMHIVNGEKRARYRLYTQVYQCEGETPAGVKFVQDIDVDITLPRFVLEEFHEPSEEEFNPSTVDTRGQGFYTHLNTVGHHPECCNGTGATKDGELCLGLYREPNESDLEDLKRMLRERDALSQAHRPGERYSEAEAITSAREYRQNMEEMERQRRLTYYGALMDSFKTHGHRMFTDDPSVLKHGKYHFMPAAKETSTTDKET